jgi:hypothetical protein
MVCWEEAGQVHRNLFSGLLGHIFVTVTLAKSVDARWPDGLPRYMEAGVLLLRGRMLFIDYSELSPLYTTHRLNIKLPTRNVTQPKAK